MQIYLHLMTEELNPRSLIEDYCGSSKAWTVQTAEEWRRLGEELAREGSSAGSSYAHAQAARKEGLFEHALQGYLNAAELSPEWALALEGAGLVTYSTGRWQEAEEYLSRALKLDGRLIHARMAFAEIFAERHNFVAAEDTLRLAVQAYREDAGLRAALGHLYLRDRRYREAEAAFQKALELDSSASALLGLASIRMFQKDYNSAIEYTRSAIDAGGETAAALIHLGIITHEFSNYREAEEYFNKALQLEPRSARNLYRMALFYWRHQSYAKAERMLRLAINCETHRSCYYSALGLMMFQDGRAYEAERLYREALRLNASDLIALHGLGTLVRLNGRAAESRELLARARAILQAGKRSLTARLAERLDQLHIEE